MKTTTYVIYRIKAEENDQFIQLKFHKDMCIGFSSNLPYEKSVDDWKFLIKALTAILKKINY